VAPRSRRQARRDLGRARDGGIWFGDQQLATVTEHAITYRDGGPPPIVIDGNALSVVVWQKAHDGEDFTAKVELGTDGNVTVHHRDGTRVQWKIEAKDPAVQRTAFLVFGATLKARID